MYILYYHTFRGTAPLSEYSLLNPKPSSRLRIQGIGYDPGFIEKNFNRVRNHHRKTMSDRVKGRDNRVCLVLDFHPALGSLNGILQEMQGIVEMSSDFFKDLPEKPLLSFRRPRNLKDHLVRSKLCSIEGLDKGMIKCGKRRSQVCNYVILGTKFSSFSTGRVYHINDAID